MVTVFCFLKRLILLWLQWKQALLAKLAIHIGHSLSMLNAIHQSKLNCDVIAHCCPSQPSFFPPPSLPFYLPFILVYVLLWFVKSDEFGLTLHSKVGVRKTGSSYHLIHYFFLIIVVIFLLIIKCNKMCGIIFQICCLGVLCYENYKRKSPLISSSSTQKL